MALNASHSFHSIQSNTSLRLISDRISFENGRRKKLEEELAHKLTCTLILWRFFFFSRKLIGAAENVDFLVLKGEYDGKKLNP